MAGIDTGGGHGGRRASNHEIPLIPFIDFLLCLVMFLLVTAVWSHMARLEADAKVPGPEEDTTAEVIQEKKLHIEIQPDRFHVYWTLGGSSAKVTSFDVRRDDGAAGNPRYSKLETRLQETWEVHGMHRGVEDPKRDRAVIHSPNDTEFRVMTAVMDALHGVRRGPEGGAALSASFAM